MLLSKHFQLYEFTHSFTAERLGIDNSPSNLVKANLSLLCRSVLEPLCCVVNRPITINSGYRCPQLNAAVHGVYNSNHMLGLAADLPYDAIVLHALASNRLSWHIDELIHECRDGRQWIHVSVLNC